MFLTVTVRYSDSCLSKSKESLKKFMEKLRRLFYPDFIRVAALFCVLIYHFQVEARRWTGAFQGIPRLESGIHGIDIGQIGVSLYFILSGASLMISKKSFHTVAFYKNRILTLIPAYYLVWFGAFVGTLLLSPESLEGVKPWTICFTVLGLDGYLLEMCPNFYKVGEWFFGCLLLIYLVYPLLRKGMERYPKLFLSVVFGLWGLCILFAQTPLLAERTFYMRIPEFVLGMYFMKYWNKHINVQGMIGVVLSIFSLWISPLFGNAQILCLAGCGCGVFMTLRMIASWIDGFSIAKIRRVIVGLAGISFEIFLLHHFALIHILRIFFGDRELSQWGGAMLFVGWFVIIGGFAWILHKVIGKIKAG